MIDEVDDGWRRAFGVESCTLIRRGDAVAVEAKEHPHPPLADERDDGGNAIGGERIEDERLHPAAPEGCSELIDHGVDAAVLRMSLE
jgi:hypothetical protein